MTDILARIDAALRRAETAADRLDRRHRALRTATRETVSELDRLIEVERRRSNG
ncbi:hypothetical protein ACUJ46_04275 [Sandaracinobacteroides sp. A072]|uniref:hypothetical protein n=1 Tax=Sandaracinobacteroides sp. A072 TaxID=3461146 RepID=UPI004043222B